MDVKEPSVHASQRSKSQTNRSMNGQATTIDAIANKITSEPEAKCSRNVTWPLLIASFVEHLCNMFIFFVIWLFLGMEAVSQLSVAWSITYFLGQAIPKAFGAAAVSQIQRFIAENKVKQADETLLYYVVTQAAYLILTLFLAFFLSVTFKNQAKLGEDDANLAYVYVPVMIIVGAFTTTFNGAIEGLLVLEGGNSFNMIRSIATSLLQLLFIMMGYQFLSSQKKKATLGELAGCSAIAQLIPAIFMIFYYQDFKQQSFQGVLRAKFKYMKSFNIKSVLDLLVKASPKMFQFGSQALLVWCCNLTVTISFVEATDIQVARIGLLLYWLGFELFGFPVHAYRIVSVQLLGLNLLEKKFIRAKEFILKGFIYALVIQIVFFIIALVWGQDILLFFIPKIRSTEREYFILYGMEYIKNAGLLPILMIPFQYAAAIFQIEGDLKLEWFLNAIHPILALVTLITLQATVGDKASMYYPEFYADIFAGISGLILMLRKIFEVMQLAKIELRRLKKKKKLEDEQQRAELLEKKDE